MGTALDSLVLAMCGTLAGVATAVTASWLNKRKTKAEVGYTLASGADELVTSALSMVKELKQDVAKLKERVAELEAENKTLKAAVEAQGQTIDKLECELEAYRVCNGLCTEEEGNA